MYTNLNLCALCFFRWMPNGVKDVFRASTLLILVIAASVWFSGNLLHIYGELVDSFSSEAPRSLPRVVKIEIAALFDFLLHVVPVYLIGLPFSSESLLYAYGLVLTWYAMVRHRIHAIYSPSVDADKGIVVAGLFSVCALLGF